MRYGHLIKGGHRIRASHYGGYYFEDLGLNIPERFVDTLVQEGYLKESDGAEKPKIFGPTDKCYEISEAPFATA